MTSEDKEKIVKILSKVSKINQSEISPDSCIAADLHIKSINRIEIAALLEDEFKVKIANSVILKVRTVEDIVAMIEKLKA